MELPLSVIMAVYNGERYLPEALNSVLSQSLEDFELIVVDDCSVDRTCRILEECLSQDSRVRIIRNRHNVGLTRSLNKALKHARGTFVARMDADDISLPMRFEEQIEFLKAHPQIGLVGTSCQEIDREGKLGKVYTTPTEPAILKWRLCFENPLHHPTVMLRKALLEEIGGYNENWDTSQDYAVFIELSKLTKLANLPQVLYLWRKHETSISSTLAANQRANAIKISQEYVSWLMGSRISLDKIQLLWDRNSGDASTAVEISRMLYELHHLITSHGDWSNQDKRTLRRHVSLKLFNHLRPHLKNLVTWKIALQLMISSPSLYFRMGFSKMSRSARAQSA